MDFIPHRRQLANKTYGPEFLLGSPLPVSSGLSSWCTAWALPAGCARHKPSIPLPEPLHLPLLSTPGLPGRRLLREPPCPQHLPRNLRSVSTSPGTLHTVLSSMGTTSGGCSFTSWILEGKHRLHPPRQSHNPAPCPPSPGRGRRAPTCAGCP